MTLNRLTEQVHAFFVLAPMGHHALCTHRQEIMDAGTTSETTFKVRLGAEDTTVVTVNGIKQCAQARRRDGERTDDYRGRAVRWKSGHTRLSTEPSQRSLHDPGAKFSRAPRPC